MRARLGRGPLCTEKDRIVALPRIGAIGQQQTHAVQQKGSLFDHLVDAAEKQGWHSELNPALAAAVKETQFGLGRQSRLHQPFAQMLAIRGLLIVKRPEVALDGKSRFSLEHFLRMSSGGSAVSQLCRRCG